MRREEALYSQMADRMKGDLHSGMRVLELACGTGTLSFLLAEAVSLWVATDYSPNMIDVAKKEKAPDTLVFQLQDATRLPYESGSFDAIVIANALHVIPKPERVLQEIERVLKMDGSLFAPIFLPMKRTRQVLLRLAGMRRENKWDEKTYPAFIENCGFTVSEEALLTGKNLRLCCVKAKKAL